MPQKTTAVRRLSQQAASPSQRQDSPLRQLLHALGWQLRVRLPFLPLLSRPTAGTTKWSGPGVRAAAVPAEPGCPSSAPDWLAQNAVLQSAARSLASRNAATPSHPSIVPARKGDPQSRSRLPSTISLPTVHKPSFSCRIRKRSPKKELACRISASQKDLPQPVADGFRKFRLQRTHSSGNSGNYSTTNRIFLESSSSLAPLTRVIQMARGWGGDKPRHETSVANSPTRRRHALPARNSGGNSTTSRFEPSSRPGCRL
jgi:hypothetical protein